jgi:ribosomal protein S18 acetylase RimI-like enzyme
VSGAEIAAGRILADAVRDLPGGLEVRPTGPDDVDGITALMRATDIAGCGHTSTNLEEVHDELASPDCGWGHGAATVWRGDEVVGALIVYDGLAHGRGWMVDLYSRPGDPRAHGINGALIDAGLREGRARFDLVFPDPDEPMQNAKAGAYANDGALRADLEERGFAEVRRYWRMKVDHWSVDALGLDDAPSIGEEARAEAADLAARGYTLRPFRDTDAELRGLHEAHSAAFLDHFDFTPVDLETWLGYVTGQTDDRSQWLVVEHDGRIVGYAQGSNRYAAEDCGYVASIGVIREQRGQGLARALLRARMADDVARGRISTILAVDADSPTGATALYESVGMVVDSEFVGFQRPLYG